MAAPGCRGVASLRPTGQWSKICTSRRTLATVPSLAIEPPVMTKSPFRLPVTTTLYRFPTLEPLKFETYAWEHLGLPLRKDILHKAVNFEGDAHREGSASTKWRSEVHGSGRKLRPQKGLGMARIGDKKAPHLRGGGVAHGPKPRDFSTELPKKVYDLAWRTALSYRYKKGELTIVEDGMDIESDERWYIRDVLRQHNWGNEFKRSLLVTTERRDNLFYALEDAGDEGRVLEVGDVDVKDILELGRIVIERSALHQILEEHQGDLVKPLGRADV